MTPIPCPLGDWESNENDDPNEQLAALLYHYEQTHCEERPQQVRDVLKACANALAGLKV